MRRAEEFATWLAARWPPLVRTLVFLGHTQREAEEVAREALARVLPAWDRERRDGDPDALAFRTALAEHDRVLRHHDAAAPDVAEEEPDLPPGLEDRLELRRELERHLATLSPDDRVRTVLVHVAGLADHEVDDVLGSAGVVPPLPLTAPEVRDACEAVPVPPASVTGVEERFRRRRRRVWVRAGAVVAAAALVVAGTAWWTSGDDGPPQGEISAASNPLPFAWFADGTLHLGRVEVAVSGVRQLFEVPDGVVYSDVDGNVVHVDDTGRQDRIGRTVPGSRLAVEPDNGWVAWADPGDGVPELVVHDTLAQEEVARRPLSAPGSSGGEPLGDHGPIALDGERVLYSSPDGDFAWEPNIDVSFALSGTLVDSAGDSRVTRSDDVLRVTPLTYRTGTVIDATDARLTHDGRYAFGTHADRAFDALTVYDVTTGRPVPMYSPSDEPVAWSYAGGTFYFAVLHKLSDKAYQDLLQMPSEGDYRIYACRPERPDPCQKIGELPESLPAPPVFPG